MTDPHTPTDQDDPVPPEEDDDTPVSGASEDEDRADEPADPPEAAA